MISRIEGHENSSQCSIFSEHSLKIRHEAARLLIHHVYRSGIREGWLSEEEEFDMVYIAKVGESSDYLIYPEETESVHSSHWIFSHLEQLQASIIVINKPAGISALLSNLLADRIITLESGEVIPIITDQSEIRYLSLGTGCFFLSDLNLVFSYGKSSDVINLARQINIGLASLLLDVDHSPNSNSNAFFVSQYQQEDIKRTVEYLPNQQQLQWLETLPKLERCTSAEDEKKQQLAAEEEEETKEKEPAPLILYDSETGESVLEERRKPIYISALLSGLAFAINMVIMSLFCRDILINTLIDDKYARLAFLAAAIPRFFVSQYFCEHIILTIAQLLFPVSQMHKNSLYYSSIRSKPLPKERELPHFTIHMPCYKEGLQSVLVPSLRSVYAAVEAYRARGGTVNVVISEDGLRLLDQKEAEERMRVYESLECGWIARPAHGADGYERRGRFKKASNLNFTYTFSLEVEEVLLELTKTKNRSEQELYDEALSMVLERRNGSTWASGDIRMGDYILLIDSDTRMPVECLIDAANEMERSPDVGALQHCSGITYVQHHYFERLFGYFVGVFTNFSISWVCANGAMAPLMGHNVFLRWSALQEIQGKIDDQNERMIFSSKHVSEDYELAMRLQMAGYSIRWVTYSNQEFREGVSLNPNDEKARWQKYAFGACEIVMNPLWKWFMGPISPLMWKFLFNSKVSTSSKTKAMSYLSSYFAIAVSLPITIAMTVAQGLFWPTLDTTFKPVFDTWIAVIFVFNVAGTIGLVLCRSRSGHKSFWGSAAEGIKHVPAIIVFFSGIAYHILCAVLAFLFSINMTWGATSKDYQQTSFGQILRRFWHCYLVMSSLLIAVTIGMSPLVSMTWRVEGVTILFPIFLTITMHFLFPVLLDPGILHKFLPRYYSKRIQAPECQQDFFYAAKDEQALDGKSVKSKGRSNGTSLTEMNFNGNSPYSAGATRGAHASNMSLWPPTNPYFLPSHGNRSINLDSISTFSHPL